MAKSKPVAGPLFDPGELRFPIRDSVWPGESGQGYALRMVAENQLIGLQQIKRWLGKSQFSVLDAADATSLHRWFGSDIASLEFALGRTAVDGREAGYAYAGQSMGRKYFLNRYYPRLCPYCIQERGYCRSAWDFSLVVACTHHGVVLSDRCGHCQTALTWNRPAVGTCRCGMSLTLAAEFVAATATELQFAAWVNQCIGRIGGQRAEDSGPARPDGLTPLMTLLWPLSLDGGFRVTYALGTVAGYDPARSDVAGRPKAPLKKARQVLAMAGGIAQRIASREPVDLGVTAPRVVISLLAESASAQTCAPDRSLALSILSTVLGQRHRTRWSGRNPQLSQLPLF